MVLSVPQEAAYLEMAYHNSVKTSDKGVVTDPNCDLVAMYVSMVGDRLLHFPLQLSDIILISPSQEDNH